MIHPSLWPSPATEISSRPTTPSSGGYVRPSDPASFEPVSVDTDDWVVLFRAVIARLERIAALPPDGTQALGVLAPAIDLRDGVRDCAGALRQLHTMFVHDTGQQRRHLIEHVRPFTERF